MFTLKIGTEREYVLNTIKEAFELAIDYFKGGAECDIVSNITGEVMLSLRDHDLPYVSSCVVAHF